MANDAAEHRCRKGSLADDAAEHLGTISGLFIQLAHTSSRRRARKFPSAATLQRASQMLAVRCNYDWDVCARGVVTADRLKGVPRLDQA